MAGNGTGHGAQSIMEQKVRLEWPGLSTRQETKDGEITPGLREEVPGQGLGNQSLNDYSQRQISSRTGVLENI